METTKDNVFDLEKTIEVTKDFKLFGNAILVRATVKVSSTTLYGIKLKQDANNKNIKDFYDELSIADKVIVKVSSEIENSEKFELGKRVIYSNYGNVTTVTNKDDEHDLDNVIENYLHDSKDVTFPKTGVTYLCHGYYIIDAPFILATKSI